MWKRNGIELYLGDCLITLQKIKAESIDIIITSPPYNLGIMYSKYNDTIPREDYLECMSTIANELRRVLSPSGSMFINLGSKPSDPWVGMDVANIFRKYFTLQNHLYWVKSIVFEEESYGNIKPINSKRFVSDAVESIYHYTKEGTVEIDRLAVGTPYKDKTNIKRWSDKQDKRCRGNALFIPYKTRQQKLQHPASYPEELVEYCLKLHGNKGVVLDPFLGSGTTAVVCDRLGFEFLGCEIDEEYFNLTIKRLEENSERGTV